MTQQTDAKGNILKFFYQDSLGRLTRKEIWNPSNFMVGAVTNVYDVSDDTNNYTVFKGQLYKVIDSEGYQRNSYDSRGRIIKTARYLNINSTEYVTQTAYDDADRVSQITYPGNAATMAYSYDNASNLKQVRSLAGTGTQEFFYTARGFDALGQVLSYTNGNGALTTNAYFANSQRLQRVKVTAGALLHQDLSYTYDNVSNLKSVSDGVYTGSASASLTNVLYDDLHRMISLSSTARGFKAYSYNAIGNIVTNQDFGTGIYKYGSKPHAVTNANSTAYVYDVCGNMATRGGQSLTYDEQNQLTKVTGGTATVDFGYADGGERLWKYNETSGSYTIWIGGIYEINNGKTLCHVFANGRRVATFEPQGGGVWSKVINQKRWYATSNGLNRALSWPLQEGRAPLVMMIGVFTGMLGICILARRKYKSLAANTRFSTVGWWHQFVTVFLIGIYFFVTTENVEAQVYTPVFYYYHNDNLGSSNVLTDRSGNRVQVYQYSAFGDNAYTDNTSAFPILNRYTGQIIDDETGLYYYHARYYDPQLGRFIQPDSVVPSPIDPQTLNRYSYCVNNPLNLTDPDGHSFWNKVGGLFKSVFKAEVAYWSAGNTWKTIGIGFLVGGWPGAVAAAAVGHATVELGTSVSYVFGPKIGQDAALAGSIVAAIAVAAINYYNVGGVNDIGSAAQSYSSTVNTIRATTAITSTALQVASESAELAGANSLAGYLNKAQNLAAVAGGITAYFVQGDTSDSKLTNAKTDNGNNGSAFSHLITGKSIIKFLQRGAFGAHGAPDAFALYLDISDRDKTQFNRDAEVALRISLADGGSSTLIGRPTISTEPIQRGQIFQSTEGYVKNIDLANEGS